MFLKKYYSFTIMSMVLLLVINASTATANLGALTDLLHTGYSDGWNGSMKSNKYWLENTNQPGAIRYYYAANNGNNGQRSISTSVLLNATDPYSQAGLLYGFDSASRSYFLVNLTANGAMTVTRRDNNGFNVLFEEYLDINPSAFNTISIQENGNQLAISVNNKKLGNIVHEAAGKGSVGIVAIGLGKFGFSNFVDDAANKTANNDSLDISLLSNDTSKNTDRDKSGVNTTSATIAATAANINSNPLDEPFKTHSIRDEFGFEQPMEAMTIGMPKSWDVKGAVQWYGKPSCALDVGLPKVHLKGTSKNGTQWVEMIPGGIWGWHSGFDAMPGSAPRELAGCDVRRIVDIQTFVNQYIPSIRPNAKTSSMRPRPDLVQEMMQEQAAEFNSFRQQNPNMSVRPEVMEVQLSYQANGRTINELLITVVLFLDQPAVDMYGGMSARLTMAMATGTVMTATVEGPPDEKLLDTIGDTIVNNEAYQARLQQHVHQRTQQMRQVTQRKLAANRAFRASVAKSSANAKTYSDILDSNLASWNKIQDMKDAGQSKLVDATLERTPWQTTYGETVYMPQEYQRVIQLPNEVFAGTNDNFFNPVNGTELNQHQY
ncbi:MAG: hypothetical protein AAGJ37_12385 [Pseudomonadota bacterium]